MLLKSNSTEKGELYFCSEGTFAHLVCECFSKLLTSQKVIAIALDHRQVTLKIFIRAGGGGGGSNIFENYGDK